MISEKELKTLIKTIDSELERKKTLPDLNPDRVQYWFNPIVAMYYYGGLRKQNRPTTSKAVKKYENDIRPI